MARAAPKFRCTALPPPVLGSGRAMHEICPVYKIVPVVIVCVCVCANKHAQQSRSTACVEGICMLHTFMCVYIYSGGRAPTGRTRLIRVALVCVHTTHVDTGAHTPNTNRRTGHQFDYTSTRVRACWHRRCNQVDKFKRSCDRTVQVRAHNFDVATHFWSPRNRDGDR